MTKNQNESGVYPTEYKALVKPIKVEETTKGGIILPDEHKDRQQFAQMEGVLIAIAPLAFTYADKSDWGDAEKPKPGDKVLFAKFAGANIKGRDGADYRIINDRDISAVLA